MKVVGGVVGILSLGMQVCQALTWYYGQWKDCPKDVTATLSSIDSLRKTLDLFTLLFADSGLHPHTKLRVEDCVRSYTEGLRALEDENKKFGSEEPASFKAAMHKFAYPFRASTLAKLKETVGQVLGQLSLAVQILEACENSRLHRKAFSAIGAARQVIDDIAVKIDLVGDAIDAVKLRQEAIVNGVSSTQLLVQDLVLGVDSLAIQQAKTTANVRQLMDDGEAKALYDVLSNLHAADPTLEHSAARRRHHPGTGQWFLGSKEYTSWKYDNKGARLWIHGKSGCSKTVLCSTVVEDMHTHCSQHSRCIMAYFYFTFADQQKQSWDALVRSLIVQLSADRPAVDSLRATVSRPFIAMAELDGILNAILDDLRSSQTQVYLIIDALDESPDSLDGRPAVQEALTCLTAAYGNLSVLVTSQTHPEIERFMRVWDASAMQIPHDATNLDIEAFVKFQTSHSLEFQEVEPPLTAMIATTIGRNSDAMMKNKTPQRIRQALDHLPPTLGATYERMLSEVPEDCWQQARRGLIWLCLCLSPMFLEALAEAMCVDPDTPDVFVEEDRVTHKGVLEIMAGFVTCASGVKCDNCAILGVQCNDPDHALEERQVSPYASARLAHFSVKKYLLSTARTSKDPRIRRYSIDLQQAECYFGRAALAYINACAHSIPKPWANFNVYTSSFPLFQYAGIFWHEFRRGEACKCGDEDAHIALETVFFANHLHNWWQLLPRSRQDSICAGRPTGWDEEANPLLLACALGLPSLARRMIQQGRDVDAISRNGLTALHVAVAQGWLNIIALLLEYGADTAVLTELLADTAMTALHLAALYGNVEAVELLLQHGADISARDENGSTPLVIASIEGNNTVVEMLLAYRCANDLQSGRTALPDTVINQLGPRSKLGVPETTDDTARSCDDIHPVRVEMG
ncbi:hypothetical protein LTR56_010062 [Elasticomyces elasticus]|nr:hypothetical protein LTR56_010062 [Elasticomyces elasticus]KAK3664995.1 hypothetical protein LTR22_004047 [Elasticomyces elasticus]KAK4931629.1 hypothetical protein LTR49_002021 [Elasticomyces elasticus]KAK5766788.1 hypothetical protein LTS12_003141 [Elasticomyces elasticus]